MEYRAIVIGTSAGGLTVLTEILEALPRDYPLPILIVQHRAKDEKSLLEEILQHKCEIEIKQADEKEKIIDGIVYFAPSNYHLLIERNKTLSLTTDRLVNFSRPSIDVLFETAADTYQSALIGIILTGASKDGSAGIIRIKQKGGFTIAQNPETADYWMMPKSAIETNYIDAIMEVSEIKDFLLKQQNNFNKTTSRPGKQSNGKK